MSFFLLAASFLAYWIEQIRQQRAIVSSPIDKWVVAYAACFLVSCLFSKVPSLSLIEAYKLLGVAMVWFATRYYCQDRRSIIRLAQVLSLVGGLLSLLGLLQLLGGVPRDWWQRTDYLSSTFVNHNHFAGLLVILLPLTLGLSAAERDRSKKTLFLFLSGLMVVAFVFTISRGGLIALTVSLVVLFLMFSRRGLVKNTVLPLAVVIFLAALAVMTVGTRPIEKRIESIQANTQEEELSLLYRLKTWEGTVSMIGHYGLVGSGPGTFDTLFLRFRPVGFNPRPVHAHNDYLQLLAECGIFAFLTAGMLLLTVFRLGWKVICRDDSRLRSGLGCGILAGWTGLLVHALFDFNFHIPANWMMASMTTGLLFSLDGPRPSARIRSQDPQGLFILTACIVLLIGSWVLGTASYYMWEARMFIKEREDRSALETVEKAIRGYPWNSEAYFLRGWLVARDTPLSEERVRSAVRDFETASSLNPYEPIYDLWKAQSLAPSLSEGSPKELLRLYWNAVQKDPQNAELLWMAGREILEQDTARRPELREGAERFFLEAVKRDLSIAKACFREMWRHEKNVTKILVFFDKSGSPVKDLVAFLEEQDLWKYHRKYFLKSLNIDPEKIKKSIQSRQWDEKHPRTLTLKEFTSSTTEAVNLGDFFFASGELSHEVMFGTDPVRLALYARAIPGRGNYPVLYVKIDGNVVDELYLDSKALRNFYTLLEAPAGAHRLSLEFVNDWKDKTRAEEDRNIWINRVEIQQAI